MSDEILWKLLMRYGMAAGVETLGEHIECLKAATREAA